MIEVHATISSPQIDKKHYHWKKLICPRNATSWEQKCISDANCFLEELFAIEGFSDFFFLNDCCAKKPQIEHFLEETGSNLRFPKTFEYQFAMDRSHWESSVFGNPNESGYICERGDWFLDRQAWPTLTVTIDNHTWHPFFDSAACFKTCKTSDEFAWDLCTSSAYLVPYLYNIARRCDFNSEWLYEGGFTADMDPGLQAALEVFDAHILPMYNVIVDKDTVIAPAGSYPMHIYDPNSLRELIRRNKIKLREAIASVR